MLADNLSSFFKMLAFIGGFLVMFGSGYMKKSSGFLLMGVNDSGPPIACPLSWGWVVSSRINHVFAVGESPLDETGVWGDLSPM